MGVFTCRSHKRGRFEPSETDTIPGGSGHGESVSGSTGLSFEEGFRPALSERERAVVFDRDNLRSAFSVGSSSVRFASRPLDSTG
jgi:hypothetical protein